MKLNSINGQVTFLLRTGKDFVKNTMSEAAAKRIIDTGKTTDSKVPGYPIAVNDTYFFPGVEEKRKYMRSNEQEHENKEEE